MWRLSPGQRLHARRFGDESVLYNDRSGATHLLGQGAIVLLGLLREAPADFPHLNDALAHALDCTRDRAFDADAAALLAHLAALALVERAPC